MSYLKNFCVAFFITLLLASCGDEPVGSAKQRANATAIAGLKENSVLVCFMGKDTIAVHVRYPNYQARLLNGYVIRTNAVNFNGNQMMDPLVRNCESIQVFSNPTDAAEIVGRILLGLPIETRHNLIVAPNGGIVEIHGFDAGTSLFYLPGIQTIRFDDPRYRCAHDLMKKGFPYDPKVCENRVMWENLN